MSATRLTTLTLVGVLATLAQTASAALIDDFNTPGLGEYSFSKILDQGDGTTNISFSETVGALGVSSSGSTGAEQVLLLRADSLGQGMELRLDAPTAFNNRDFGLAIGATHADLGGGVAADNRNTADYAFISWRNLTFLNTRGFIGNAEITLGQNTTSPAETLFIARTLTDDIELGWYTGVSRNVARTITPATLAIFDNVGFYADIRADGDGFSGADNLRIVPEPAAAVLVACMLGGLSAARRR